MCLTQHCVNCSWVLNIISLISTIHITGSTHKLRKLKLPAAFMYHECASISLLQAGALTLRVTQLHVRAFYKIQALVAYHKIICST